MGDNPPPQPPSKKPQNNARSRYHKSRHRARQAYAERRRAQGCQQRRYWLRASTIRLLDALCGDRYWPGEVIDRLVQAAIAHDWMLAAPDESDASTPKRRRPPARITPSPD